MKKKILLFASTVIAAMAMMTSATFAAEILGDVNGDGEVNMQDSALILSQALSKDYAATNPSFNLAVANLDEDKPFENTGEITANDAALAFKMFLEKTSLYLDINLGQVTYSEKVTMDTTVKEVVERFVGPNSTYEKAINNKKSAIQNAVSRVKFPFDAEKMGISNEMLDLMIKSGHISPELKETIMGMDEVKLVDDNGWDIFAYALRSLVAETPVYDKTSTNTKIFVPYVDKCTSNKLNELSLAKMTKNGTDMSTIDFKGIQNAYQKGLEIVKHQPSAEDLIAAKNGVTDITEDKYKVSVVLNDDATKEFHYNGKADDTLDTLINNAATAELLDYDTVTVGKVNDAMGKAKDENGKYGSVKVSVNGRRNASVTLVER